MSGAGANPHASSAPGPGRRFGPTSLTAPGSQRSEGGSASSSRATGSAAIPRASRDNLVVQAGFGPLVPWWQAKLGCLDYSCFCQTPYVKCMLKDECDTEVIVCDEFDQAGTDQPLTIHTQDEVEPHYGGEDSEFPDPFRDARHPEAIRAEGQHINRNLVSPTQRSASTRHGQQGGNGHHGSSMYADMQQTIRPSEQAAPDGHEEGQQQTVPKPFLEKGMKKSKGAGLGSRVQQKVVPRQAAPPAQQGEAEACAPASSEVPICAIRPAKQSEPTTAGHDVITEDSSPVLGSQALPLPRLAQSGSTPAQPEVLAEAAQHLDAIIATDVVVNKDADAKADGTEAVDAAPLSSEAATPPAAETSEVVVTDALSAAKDETIIASSCTDTVPEVTPEASGGATSEELLAAVPPDRQLSTEAEDDEDEARVLHEQAMAELAFAEELAAQMEAAEAAEAEDASEVVCYAPPSPSSRDHDLDASSPTGNEDSSARSEEPGTPIQSSTAGNEDTVVNEQSPPAQGKDLVASTPARSEDLLPQVKSSPAKDDSLAATVESPPAGNQGVGAKLSGSMMSSRIQAYQAACASPAKSLSPGPSSARNAKPAGSPKFPKSRMSSQSSNSEFSSPTRPLRKLANVSQQRVLKTGITDMQKSLVTNKELQVPISEMPKRGDGSPLLLTHGAFFLSRLLRDGVELKSCMDNDAAAAQADVKHLRTEQLLTIRAQTLDFLTSASSHVARSNFLEIVEKHLFEKLAQDLLRGLAAKPKKAVLHALGLRMTLTLGVVSLLASNWGEAGLDVPVLPELWAFGLEEADWPDRCKAALFNSRELWIEPLLGENPDFAMSSGGHHVAVARERCVGEGQNRMLHWEIASLDPQTEDVLAELLRVTCSHNPTLLVNELVRALPEMPSNGSPGTQRLLADERTNLMPSERLASEPVTLLPPRPPSTS